MPESALSAFIYADSWVRYPCSKSTLPDRLISITVFALLPIVKWKSISPTPGLSSLVINYIDSFSVSHHIAHGDHE